MDGICTRKVCCVTVRRGLVMSIVIGLVLYSLISELWNGIDGGES